jgi:hypothetical protein
LSGFTPAVDTKPTELASVLGEAGGDPARHVADTGRPVRKSRKRGTGPEPVRPTRTGAGQPVPVSAGEDPAEWSNEVGDGLIELLENETDEIGDSLIELLENGTSDGLSEMWDEEAEELPEPTEAGGEPEKAPWTPKVWLDAFLECTDASPLGPAIRQMIDDCNLMSHREASQDVLRWVDTESSTWPSHCRLVDEIWARYAPRFAEICECDEAQLVKPSGPLHATICAQWRYPTFNASRLAYGMTFDPSNPCLRVQKTKLGTSPRVLTFDTFPVRIAKPKKGEIYDDLRYWTEYCDLATEFQHEIAKYSKIRIVLGKQNWLLVQEHIEKQNDVVITRIPLFIKFGSKKETIQFYGKPAELLVVQEKVMRNIRQIIIPSYHGEWLFYANDPLPARIMDMTWNACAAIAGIDTVNAGYFEWKVTHQRKSGRIGPFIQRLIYIVGEEKKGVYFDEEKVKEEYSDWIHKNSELLNPTKGSLARQILYALGDKGRETHAAGGWQGLVKGRATNAAGGYQNLVKGCATNAAGGYQNLAKNREVQAAGGWQSLVKARETQAAGGYQNLAKGHETQAAHWEKIANARWQAIKNGPLIDWENSIKKADRTRAKRFQELNTKPWRERAKWLESQVTSKQITWYSAENPNGLRYEGDEKKAKEKKGKEKKGKEKKGKDSS